MSLAPVALFIYKRASHLQRTINSLSHCIGFDESRIFVFADGPRTDADIAGVREARRVAHSMLGENATYIEQEKNQGLARSIIAGVTRLCDDFGNVIVIEDDLVLAPNFLKFLNEGLCRYADESRVMQVSGHAFETERASQNTAALLLPFATSWGWATWQRAWKHFDLNATGWQQLLANPADSRRFNLNGKYDFRTMLERQIRGEIDSWAILWYYTIFKMEGLVLFPPQTLVLNEGMDTSASHTRSNQKLKQTLRTESDWVLPEDIVESTEAEFVFESIQTSTRRSLISTIKTLRPSDIRRVAALGRKKFNQKRLEIREER